jgi:CheY-like chemotaxis protein
MNERAEGSKLRVLVVDDHVDGADAFSAVIHAFGCDTAVAYNGPDAIGTASVFSPHLAFIDLEMPRMNGRDVVRHLRANHLERNIHLVCLTGRGLPEDRRLCLEAGFDEFVTKPIEPTALAEMLAAARARL